MLLVLKIIGENLILRVLLLVLSYFEGIMKAYVVIVVFGLITASVIGTGLEEFFVKVLSVTPGIGLGKHGNFTVDPNNIMIFFLVWGAIVSLISGIIKRYIAIKISLGNKALLLFGLTLHLVSLLIFSVRFGFNFSIVFIGILFTTYLLSLSFLRIIIFFKRVVSLQ